MEISSARYEGDELILITLDPDAVQFMKKFKPGRYEIRPVKKKRSLDANAYCWVLCGKIATAMGCSKEEVYRKNIREGNAYIPLTLDPQAVDTFMASWGGEHGIGWVCDVVERHENYVFLLAYYGSSTYNTQQMSQLIDRLVQDAKALEIETLPPWELERMLEAWNGTEKTH